MPAIDAKIGSGVERVRGKFEYLETNWKRYSEWADRVVCKYLRNQIRASFRQWIASRIGIPVIGPILTGTGWFIGVIFDVLIPILALGGLTVTGIGFPVALLLGVALVTATCD